MAVSPRLSRIRKSKFLCDARARGPRRMKESVVLAPKAQNHAIFAREIVHSLTTAHITEADLSVPSR